MSLANEITLTVDPANDGNPESRVFERGQYISPDRVYYTRKDVHTLQDRDQIMFRTLPRKVTATSYGVARSIVKSTKDHSITNKVGETIKVPATIETQANFPVGMTSAAILEMVQNHIATLDVNAIVESVLEDLNVS